MGKQSGHQWVAVAECLLPIQTDCGLPKKSRTQLQREMLRPRRYSFLISCCGIMMLGCKPLNLIQHSLIHTAYWKTKHSDQIGSHTSSMLIIIISRAEKSASQQNYRETEQKKHQNSQPDSKLGANTEHKMAGTQV